MKYSSQQISKGYFQTFFFNMVLPLPLNATFNNGGLINQKNVSSYLYFNKRHVTKFIMQLKHEYKEIQNFFSLGCKNYCVVYSENNVLKTVTKIRGLNLSSASLENIINADLFDLYIQEHLNGNSCKKFITQKKKLNIKFNKLFKNKPTNLLQIKDVTFRNKLCIKRYLLNSSVTYETFPYGW